MKDDAYYVGIDLGTSRTSIATSTGVRLTTISCVGYPKDVISQKRLGKSYLLGQEALDNRLAVRMVWPLAEGVVREEDDAIEATRLILQDIIHKSLPDVEPGKIHAAIGVPAKASIESKKLLINMSKDVVGKLLIVSEPFAVAYNLDRFDETLVIDIGAGTVDLCRIHGSLPDEDDQLTLKTAGNYLDGEITKEILGAYPGVQLTPQIIKKIKEKHGYVSNPLDKISVTLTEKGKPSQYDITKLMRECCLKLTDPICAAVQELVGEFDPEFQEKLRNNIVVAGGGSRLKGIDRAIEKSLQDYGGGEVTTVQDAEYCGAVGTLKMAMEMPPSYWEKI